LKEDEDLVAEPDQENQMDKEPTQPSENSSKPNHFQIGDRSIAADGGHLTLVMVPERRHRPAFDRSHDVPGSVPAHLHRNRTNARQRLTGLMSENRHIADNEHLRMPRDRQVFVDVDPAGTIDFSSLTLA
jgi:hypothetical protein